MMHPILVADLAAERHADLLRTAEAHRRRAALTRHHRRTPLARGADRLNLFVTTLRSRVAASTQPDVELCCA